MVGVKDVTFVGLVLGGLVTLGLNLMPPSKPEQITHYNTSAYTAPEHTNAVAKVDQEFRAHWEAEKLQMAEPAPDLLQARRLALGLMGTIPSLEEIRQFEALPPNERMPWWIDHILKDRRFADYFAERFMRTFVGGDDGQFILYRGNRFRSWIADQLHKNRPYDALVRDLITSNGLWTDHPATNFITVTCTPAQKNAPDPVRLAGRVTRAFLGLRLDCAQCHNHPFAAWKQTDFEGFSAFFGQTHVGMKGVYDGPGEYEVEDKKTKQKHAVKPHVPFSPELLPAKGSRREQLAAWVTHKQNPYFARATVNRVWALLTGRPLIEPVDNLEPDGSPGDSAVTQLGGKVLRVLAEDFVAHHFDLRRLVRVIASTEAFRMDSAADFEITEAHEKAWAVFPLTRLRPEQVAGSTLQGAQISTINADSHIITRLGRFGQQNDFIKRYGDYPEDEFDGRGGTIPQRLLMMNGKMVREHMKEQPMYAVSRIAWMAPTDPKAIEVAYLALLSRRPTPEEAKHFEDFMTQPELKRVQKVEDLFWTLVNSTEFSWNH